VITNNKNITNPTDVLIIFSIIDKNICMEKFDESYHVNPEKIYNIQKNKDINIVKYLPVFSIKLIKFSVELMNLFNISNQLKINSRIGNIIAILNKL